MSKQRLYSIILLSIAMILMLVSIAGGAPRAYIPNYGSNNVSVINTATDNIKAMVNVYDFYGNLQGVAAILDRTKIDVMNQTNRLSL